MREILFKGKRVDNGEWIEGYYYYPVIAPIMGCIGYFINAGGYKAVEIDPETVCQYTGLTDKNSVKIFEGDIVSTDIERPYLIVEFRDGCFMFNCNDGGEDYYDIMLPILNEPQTQYKYGEVIGNIFDNTELLEGGGSDE
jgi:uncharacterized phage protein (TIGR01671 family)